MEAILKRTTKSLGGVALLAAALALCVVPGCKGRQGGEDVLARVNGRKITRTDVDKYYRSQIESAQQQPSEEQALSLKLSILRELVDNEIMMQRAEKLGLLATDEEVDAKLNEFKAPYTKEEFDRLLTERKLSVDDLKREFRRTVTTDKLINKEISSKINISDKDIADYYNAHKAEFNLIEPQYRLAQVVVTVGPAAQGQNVTNKAQTDADAKKKIQQLYNRLESGEDFATVAMKYSEQPDAQSTGGDIGMVPESALQRDKQTFDAINRLKPGQYTQPLPAVDPQSHQSFGYRVIKLISKEPAGQRELNDPRVQQFVRDQLRTSREQLIKSAYYESLHNNASIENYLADQILKSQGGGK
jgi:peptidyl-prolyl cis-trans isomerase SurA